MFFSTTEGLTAWYSQALPSPTSATGESAKRFLASDRCAGFMLGSTPWRCVLRNSTPAYLVCLQTSSKSTSERSLPHWYVTNPSLSGVAAKGDFPNAWEFHIVAIAPSDQAIVRVIISRREGRPKGSVASNSNMRLAP